MLARRLLAMLGAATVAGLFCAGLSSAINILITHNIITSGVVADQFGLSWSNRCARASAWASLWSKSGYEAPQRAGLAPPTRGPRADGSIYDLAAFFFTPFLPRQTTINTTAFNRSQWS